MTPSQIEAAARRWASTLDNDDFSELPRLMSPTCVYLSPGGQIDGPAPITESYRSNSEWAHETFDRIVWDSSVEVDSDDSALVTFTDRTDHAGHQHVYRCQQRVWFDEDGLIRRILHIDLEGETEALDAFFATVGVTRPGA